MKVKSLIILSLMFVFSSVVFSVPNKNVYGIFSETFSGVNIYKYGEIKPEDENAVAIDFWYWTGGQQGFEATNVSSTTLEGKINWLLTATNAGESGGGGFAVKNSAGVLDMSAYSEGSIKFIVKSSCSAMENFKVGVKINGTEYYQTLKELNNSFTADDNWWEFSIPINYLNLDKVQYLFLFGLDKEHYNVGDTLEIDNIRWEKKENETAQQIVLSVAKVDTDATASSFSFDVNIDNLDLNDTTWKAANEYIKIELNKLPEEPCYIRFYTDNKSDKANPKYTGSSNPAGLINEIDTFSRLEACWRVSSNKISKDNLKIYQDDDVLSDKKDERTYCYIWLQDLNTTDYNLEYSYIWNNGSDISKRGTQLYGATFLAGGFPLYVYLGANFAQAVAGATYTTNTLTVELYYE